MSKVATIGIQRLEAQRLTNQLKRWVLCVPMFITLFLIWPSPASAEPNQWCIPGNQRESGQAYCCFWEGDQLIKCGKCPGPTEIGCTVQTVETKKVCRIARWWCRLLDSWSSDQGTSR
jgi:hypothetical protein